MPHQRDLSTLLTDAVQDVSVPPSLLSDVHARSRRRAAVRRAGGLGLAALAATAALAVVTVTGADDGDETLAPASAPSAPSAVTASPSAAGVRVPDLVGKTHAEVEDVLADLRTQRGSVLELTLIRSVASDEAPAGTLIAQHPAANAFTADERSRITLVFSSGGPAVPLEDVPALAAARLRSGLMPGEQVLRVDTAAGTAWKTDAMLTGPCAAVRLAYRTFLDPQYDDTCS